MLLLTVAVLGPVESRVFIDVYPALKTAARGLQLSETNLHAVSKAGYTQMKTNCPVEIYLPSETTLQYLVAGHPLKNQGLNMDYLEHLQLLTVAVLGPVESSNVIDISIATDAISVREDVGLVIDNIFSHRNGVRRDRNVDHVAELHGP